MTKSTLEAKQKAAKIDKMTPRNRSADRHRPSTPIRLSPEMTEQLRKLAVAKETTVTAEVKQAVREYLERHGLRDPPPGERQPTPK